ncbi:MAG: beta-propeller fold lactonase family protein [Acidithiobacillus sp.]|nr:beta-propeller fold lactonase family protein [Acidithiobacillus sp.]
MASLKRFVLIVFLGMLSAQFPFATLADAATPGVQTTASESGAVPLEPIIRFTTNGTSSYAIGRAGRLWAWGSNKSGELGDGSTIDSSTPVLVRFPAASGHAVAIRRLDVNQEGSVYALDSDGHLWAWGNNDVGQLGVGDGDLRNRSFPTRVRFPATFGRASIVRVVTTHDGYYDGGSSVYDVYAVDSLGRLWGWGGKARGPAADLGSTDDHSMPVRVRFPTALGSASIVRVAFGEDGISSWLSVYAIDSLGRLWAWGDNEVGQLGNGLGGKGGWDGASLVPILVRFPVNAGTVSIVSVETGNVGNGYFFALDQNGRLWACGENGNGALGDGSTTNRSTPVRVHFPTHWWQRTVSIVRVVATHDSGGVNYAIDDAGHLWAWGGNRRGAIGQDTSAPRLTPQRVQFPAALHGDSIVSVTADRYAAYAIDSAGRLWDWGNNRYGQLGNGSLANRFIPPAPVQFPDATAPASIIRMSAQSPNIDSAFAHALDSAGKLWAWGYNAKGQPGDGLGVVVASPMQIRFQAGVKNQTPAPFPGKEGATSKHSAAKPQFVYVADREGISVSRINTTTGALTEIPGSPFPDRGGPTFIVANPSSTVAYVTNRSNTVSAYRINATTGALTEVPGSPFKAGSQPYFVRFNSSGTVAYVANWMSGYFTAYRINPSGALSPTNDKWSSIENFERYLPHPDATVSPAGPFAYWVANDGILVFRIDPENGYNHEIQAAKIDSPSARAITLNPEGTLAYVTETPPWQTGAVSAYHVNASTGALTPVPRNPVATGFLRPDPVAINPTGTFAYIADRGNGGDKGTISAYRIDTTTGALTAIPGSPFATGMWPTFVTVVQP